MFKPLLFNPNQNMGYGELFVDTGLLGMLNIYSFIYVWLYLWKKSKSWALNQNAWHHFYWFLLNWLVTWYQLPLLRSIIRNSPMKCIIIGIIGIFTLHYLIAIHEKPCEKFLRFFSFRCVFSLNYDFPFCFPSWVLGSLILITNTRSPYCFNCWNLWGQISDPC